MISSTRLAGIAGLFTVSFILAFEVIIPSAIAGNRVSGTTDASAILAYYNHPALAWTYWVNGVTVLTFLVFIYGLYLALKEKSTGAGMSVVLLAATGIAVVEIPVLLTKYSLESALVTLSGQYSIATDPAARIAFAAVGVGVFRFWDILYNSMTYWLEGGYLLLFSLVVLKTSVLRRSVGWLGVAVAAYQFFNTAAVLSGIPDSLTLPGNLLFVAWFVGVSVSMIRLKGDL